MGSHRGEVVERCYCLPVEKTHIPSSAQLLPEYLFRAELSGIGRYWRVDGIGVICDEIGNRIS